MALISPVLDNRTYQQLRDELVARIPVYAPEWTDHNESDPGIALLELFAYLGESLLYRFNQIPETTQIEFLRLLGVRPRPAQPAHVLLAAATDRAAGVQVLRGTEALAGAVSFETDDETYVWPLELVAAGKTATQPADSPTGRESSADALARAGIAAEDAQFYQTTLVSADPLAPDAVMVDVGAQVDQALWIGLLSKPTTDRAALVDQTVFVGIAFDETIEPPIALAELDAAEAAELGSDNLTRDPPPMTWRLWNGPGAADAFRSLAVIGDTTRGLLTSGVIKVVLPSTLPTLDAAAAARAMATGGADVPPPLDDVKLAERVIAWIQVSRPATADRDDVIGRVRWVGVNAVGGTQARTATTELIGTGTGDADQRYPLTHEPVLAGTVTVQVEEPAGWTVWSEVQNFATSTADDRYYTVDLDDGVIAFGQRRVPQIGERIRATGYRYGGGAIGNVAAGSITSFSGVGAVDVANPLPAVGGADRVALPDALDAIPLIVHRHDRAVIADDFEQLATEVNGVARANAIARMHPDNPTDEAAGVVSVVVFGAQDLRDPTTPLPDLGLLRRVARYLDARRLITTELYVIPPEYVRITLSVGVQVRTGYQADAVRRWVEQILRQYLAPLPPNGPEGSGWPLGRTIRRAELEAVAVQVEGVEYLEDLLLGTVIGDVVTPDAVIPLQRWQVPAVSTVTVSVGPPLPLGSQDGPAPSPKIPVPLPVEVC